jgi:hypothetical protein
LQISQALFISAMSKQFTVMTWGVGVMTYDRSCISDLGILSQGIACICLRMSDRMGERLRNMG